MRSIDMFPGQPMHSAPYGLLAYAIEPREHIQLFALLTALANRANIIFGQLCAVVLLTVYGMFGAALEYLTALRCHVLRVCRVIAQKQVIRAYTQRVVTVVTNHRVFRDCAVVQLPRYARCLLHIAQVVDRSISVGILQSCPFPATCCDLDLWPKAILDRTWAGRKVIAVSATTQRAVAGAGRVVSVHIDVLSVWPCVTRSIPQFS